MRYFWLLCLLGLLDLPRPGQAQTTPIVRWQHFYGIPLDDTGGYTVAMPGGGYMLVGQREVPSTNTPNRWLYFVRTDAQGDTLWTKYYRPDTDPQVYSLLVDATGNLLITGSASNRRFGFVAKLTSAIVPLWVVSIIPTDPLVTATNALYPVVMADGNFAVVYWQNGMIPNTVPQVFFSNQYLRKLDSSTGATVWDKAFSPYLASLGYNVATYFSGLVAMPGGLMAFVDGGKLSPTPQGMRAIMLLDGNGTITKLKERTNNVVEGYALPFSNGQNVFMSRRQTVTKLTFAGDTVWHTVVPPRYPNRQWDGKSII
ncbi:MAG: hypothetical protein ACRYFX_20260 [Janthinobacterium lividum]